MKFCQHCGNSLLEEAVMCPKCGCVTGRNGDDDRAGCLMPLVSFLFPLFGLILWAIWKHDYPKRSHACGKAALVSIVLSTVIGCLAGVAYALWFYYWIGLVF